MKDMIQPVTAPSSFELVSKLEELSGLASQIVRFSDELRSVSQSDSLADSASVCALLPVALSNAQECLSLLQSIGQTSTPPPPPSPFVPLALGPPGPSPPAPAIAATSLNLTLLSRPTTPATQMWPFFPPARASFEPTPIRHGVSIAELVDEEGSSPGTRGGMNSRPTATCAGMSLAQSYPPLFISVVDATPHPTGREIPEAPEVSEMKSPRSSPSFPSETPRSFTTQVPGPSRSPLVSSANNNRRSTANKGGKTLRRLRLNRVPLVASEVPERRMTRSSAKRKAAEDLGMGTEPLKRVKTESP